VEADVCKRCFGAVSSAIWEDVEAVGEVVVAGVVEVSAVEALVAAGVVLAEVLAVVEVLAAEVREAVGDRDWAANGNGQTQNPSQMPTVMF